MLTSIANYKGDLIDAESFFISSIRTAETIELKQRAYILLAQLYKSIGNEEAIDKEINLLKQAESELSIINPLFILEMQGDAYARKARFIESNKIEYYHKALMKFESLYNNGYTTFNIMQNIAIIYQEMNDFYQAKSMLGAMLEKYPGNYLDTTIIFDRVEQIRN